MTQNPDISHTIIDKDTLCEIFGISESTLRSQYKSWPHFYVCKGRDLRSARFVIEKVVEHLEYANRRQKAGNLDRPSPKGRISAKKKARVQNKGRRNSLESGRSEADIESGADPLNLLSVFD
jgi:hypothetical protein